MLIPRKEICYRRCRGASRVLVGVYSQCNAGKGEDIWSGWWKIDASTGRCRGRDSASTL